MGIANSLIGRRFVIIISSMRQLTLIYSDLPRPTRVDSGVKNNFSWFLSIFYIIPQNVL